ncbi:hypothetical protein CHINAEXTREME_13160 [Halobiforma lacisalsi AJ5]|uniref:PepSY domain-containing protein n=1 Tax=Natronobacterium lacisalsi AJ5 TaxID=358396 RepID=M0LJF7_NATLA|nr:hypothetical protein [Halobiforma lacisalsi]APX00089.1 hypothetical protein CHINAEXTREME_13160 [Halobiforma lacisalsi AJ5]EMA32539.1 hypothetical protein C445_10497 [Halobiforma lacisalsi AJ5]
MTDRLSADDAPAIATKEDAAVTAYDALSDAGCDAVVTSMPRRTRSTWIVPATSEDSSWRVHIDPRTGKTRIVETPE